MRKWWNPPFDSVNSLILRLIELRKVQNKHINEKVEKGNIINKK
jgi:hypothetical protein